MPQHNTPDGAHKNESGVNAQLRDLERQGGELARVAHFAAGALLVAFSIGSLISISHAAFVKFLSEWNAGALDVPDGLSLIVNVLLVLAADIALLYAASVLRVLIAAQAPKSEQRVHIWAMVGASALESSTYLYLAWQFDRPTTAFLWIIVIGRAFAAPLFAAYLSMARPLPVAPRDVAYQAALASGKGVVRDVATLAADPDAPLDRKVRIYTASALMTHADRTRFDDIIEAVATDAPTRITITPLPTPPTMPPDGPRGGGLPTATQGGRDHLSDVPPVPMVSGFMPYEPSSLPPTRTSGNGHRPVARVTTRTATRKRTGKLVGKSTGKRMLTYAQRNHQRVLEVRGWLAAGEAVSQQRIRKAYGVDNRRAKEILAEAQTRALHVVGE